MFRKLFGKPKAVDPETEVAPAVIIHIFDTQIDLFPIAAEITAIAPHPTGMTVLKLATLAQESFDGSYIRVAEYPDGVDRDYAKLLIQRVQQWAQWEYRGAQLSERNPNEYTVEVEQDACPAMKERAGKTCAAHGFERLPLDNCWQRCFCDYRWDRKRRHG